MEVEKTIEFILDHQAQAEGRMARLERAVSQLVRYGISLRSDVRRHDKAIIRLDKAMPTWPRFTPGPTGS